MDIPGIEGLSMTTYQVSGYRTYVYKIEDLELFY